MPVPVAQGKMCKKVASFAILLFSVTFVQSETVQQPETHIIGGKVVDIASHSYLVSIRHRQDADGAYLHKCGGSIYTPSVIITAAQCFFNMNTEDRIMIVAGGNTRTGVDGQLYPVKKWIMHSQWNPYTIDYDIAILILETPLDMHHPDISAITIRAQRPAVGRYASIAGWGYREEFGPSSYNLEEAHVPIVSNEDCTKAYGAGEITERMICAGYLSSGHIDACQGDTGGPLVVSGELVGLVSWGRGCARPGYPGVYTFVGSLKKWIDDTIAANK